MNYVPKKRKNDPLQLAGATTEQMLDNFLLDLFSNSLDPKALNLPLDKSLLVHTAKKQSMERLLNSESAGQLLSHIKVRGDSANLASAHQLSGQLHF